MRISDWSSDVCSSDLPYGRVSQIRNDPPIRGRNDVVTQPSLPTIGFDEPSQLHRYLSHIARSATVANFVRLRPLRPSAFMREPDARQRRCGRSEDHTSELQSLMRISYAAFSLTIKHTCLLNLSQYLQ